MSLKIRLIYMSQRKLKWLLAAIPIPWAVSDEFYTIRRRYAGRVLGSEAQPILNPQYPTISSWIEDDYVLIKRVGESGAYKELKGRLVLLRDPADRRRTVLRRLQAVEGDWITKSQFLRMMVPAGHGYVGEGEEGASVPLALIEGVATQILWPPGRQMPLDTLS
jgi:inner membrane protease subunit 2